MLGVLDGAVLVVSAVPTVVFVNKIDRRDAREDGVLQELATRLTHSAAAAHCTACGNGSRR